MLRALVERSGVDPAAVDDVVMGCCDTIGSQAGDVARTAWLVAGLPDEVPGVTIDRQCGSSQQAVHFAAQGVMSGTQDLVVAGGLQNMSAIPISSAMLVAQQYGFSTPFAESPGWVERYGDAGDQPVPQRGDDRREVGRQPLRHGGLRAGVATAARWPRSPRAGSSGRSCRWARPPSTSARAPTPAPERMAALQPLLPEGRITAGVSSQISDGASAMLIASERAVSEHGLTPRARIHHLSVRGDDPVWMLTGPIRATRHALERSGMSVDDIDLFECNEAFASVVLAWERELGVPHEKVNVNGGAIALGHPIGATGTRLMTTLLHELERTGGRYGLQTMCEGGGQANVTIIERL